jgi:hypothetical protein
MYALGLNVKLRLDGGQQSYVPVLALALHCTATSIFLVEFMYLYYTIHDYVIAVYFLLCSMFMA